MPETRYISESDGKGKILNRVPYEVSDEELAEEKEQDAMRKAEKLIDAISNLNGAKVFLKKLVRRLIKNGALP